MFNTACSIISTRRVVWLIALISVPVLLAARFHPTAKSHQLFRDPLAVASSRPDECCEFYFGFVSALGSLLWASATAVCIMGWIGARVGVLDKSREPYFLVAALFSSVLCLDDTFMLHETAFPSIGVREEVIYGLIGAIFLVFLWFAQFLFSRQSGLLGLVSLFFLGSSVLLDLFTKSSYLLEDGFKFVGIVTWVVFHVVVVMEELSLHYDRRLCRD